MRILGLLLIVSLIVGCRASYQVQNVGGANTTRLERDKGIYVTIPTDGAYGSTTYPGSGQIVSQAVAAAFSRHAVQVHVAQKQLTSEETISTARNLGAGYLVMPKIAQWEQRATEWSGRPSRMSIRLTILDVMSGGQISSTSIEGRSRIVSFTSTSPESLLRDPLARYVNGLY